MTLSSAVCSITRTQRGRYFWAAWWTGAPCEAPFRKPDAANGGARSEAEALAEAERAAGRHLNPIEPYWARAFTRVLRGEAAPPRRDPAQPRPAPRSPAPDSPHAVLGVPSSATPEEIRAAYRQRALATHPDQGGDAAAFRAVQGAYDRLRQRRRRAER